MKFESNSEVDVAHAILMKNGAPMYYKDLVMEVIKKMHKPQQSLSNTIAEVYPGQAGRGLLCQNVSRAAQSI